jgi:2-polyprenyl-3-methyl-5-hydroxy-6-metoxy-1,4-benzoquinol methylase
MIDWSGRHPGPELMDRQDIPAEDLFQNYRELHTINRRLGGYAVTLRGLSQVIRSPGEYSVLDAGSGGGDMLRTIEEWGKRKNFSLHLSGIDSGGAAMAYSKKHSPHLRWIHGDIFSHLREKNKYDVICCSLFMHHFSDEMIISLLRLMQHAARRAIVINDLHRHRLANFSIKWLTHCFSRSYLVKNDAPLSVQRGFTTAEWKSLLHKAGISSAVIQWRWAFRHLIVIHSNASR